MKYKFRLKKGFTIHIDGIPYKYMGAGIVGTNTNLKKYYSTEDENWLVRAVKASKNIDSKSWKGIK